MTPKNNQAVVLSGGGATGAYEIGVLEGLFESDGFDPGIYTGTYRPSADATGGLPGVLEFTTDRIDKLIEQGYRDARGHDCQREGCVTLS